MVGIQSGVFLRLNHRTVSAVAGSDFVLANLIDTSRPFNIENDSLTIEVVCLLAPSFSAKTLDDLLN